LLAPIVDGSVAFVSTDAAEPKVAPFVPPLSPDNLPRWTKPAVLADEKSALVGDGREMLYVLAKVDRPKPHLAAVAEKKLAAPLLSLTSAGSTAIGLMRKENGDELAGFNAGSAAMFAPTSLPSQLRAGPFPVGQSVIVSLEPDRLLSFDPQGKQQWEQSQHDASPLESVVLARPGHAVAIYQSGVVVLIDPNSGKELGRRDIGETLGRAATIAGNSLWAAGSDGTIHRIEIPRSQQ